MSKKKRKVDPNQFPEGCYFFTDIDGTIADESWRVKAKWRKEELEEAFRKAKPIREVIDHMKYWQDKVDMRVCTSRPEMFRAITEQWLKAQGLKFKTLKMRQPEDRDLAEYKSSHITKDNKGRRCVWGFESDPKVVRKLEHLLLPIMQREPTIPRPKEIYQYGNV